MVVPLEAKLFFRLHRGVVGSPIAKGSFSVFSFSHDLLRLRRLLCDYGLGKGGTDRSGPSGSGSGPLVCSTTTLYMASSTTTARVVAASGLAHVLALVLDRERKSFNTENSKLQIIG